MSSLARGIFCVALFFGLLVSVIFTQGLTGQISSTVVDPSGNVVAGARVSLLNTGTGQMRETSADTLGNFVFTELLPGTYQVSVSQPGFQKFEQKDIALTAAERVVLR